MKYIKNICHIAILEWQIASCWPLVDTECTNELREWTKKNTNTYRHRILESPRID